MALSWKRHQKSVAVVVDAGLFSAPLAGEKLHRWVFACLMCKISLREYTRWRHDTVYTPLVFHRDLGET